MWTLGKTPLNQSTKVALQRVLSQVQVQKIVMDVKQVPFHCANFIFHVFKGVFIQAIAGVVSSPPPPIGAVRAPTSTHIHSLTQTWHA